MKRVCIGHTDTNNIKLKHKRPDSEVYRIRVKAKRNYHPTLAGKYEWSPALAKGITTIMYWRH